MRHSHLKERKIQRGIWTPFASTRKSNPAYQAFKDSLKDMPLSDLHIKALWEQSDKSGKYTPPNVAASVGKVGVQF